MDVTKSVSKPRSAWEAREQELQRPLCEVLTGQRQELIRRPARELLRMLRQVKGSSDTPETRVLLRDVAAELEERRQDWPPDRPASTASSATPRAAPPAPVISTGHSEAP